MTDTRGTRPAGPGRGRPRAARVTSDTSSDGAADITDSSSVADVADPVADVADPVADVADPVADVADPVADEAVAGRRVAEAGRARARLAEMVERRRADRGRAIAPPWDLFRDVGVPLGIFALTRLVQILVLDWMLQPGQTLTNRLLSWDADWFIRVATNGYPQGYTYDSGGNVTGNELAFFPLYPWLIRFVDDLGVTPAHSALAVSWIAAAVASVLVYALGRRLATGAGKSARVARRVGYALVVLCFAQPLSIVFSMGYSEPVFLALVVGMFLATYRRWWLLAGVLGFAAGLTRPTGAAAAIGLAVAAGMCVANRSRRTGEKAAAVIGAVVALAGVPAYIGWVGLRVGHLDAWFKIQTAGWGTTFDYGHSTWEFVTSTLRTGVDWVAISVLLILVAATVATFIGIRQNTWLPLSVYGFLAYVLVVGQAGFFHSKPRLLLPALLVLLPAAFAAARARPSRAAWWLVGYAAIGLWYGAYMVTVWRYAI